jgi:formylglycine-generating enzyme required for sulfatase activity
MAVETVPAVAEPLHGSPRDPLLAQHREARRRRDAAPLNSEAYREASLEIARIEVAIAALERRDPTAAAQ